MGSRRSILGNILAALVAILAILNYLPWFPAALLIITVAILGIIPSRRKLETATLSSNPIPTTTPPVHLDPAPQEQHTQTRPIQRLPQAIIEALRPVPAPPATSPGKPVPVEKKEEPIVDTGHPVQLRVPAGDYESFEYGLHEDEELSVELTADGPLNVYILTEENLSSLDSDQEFWYETGSERTRTASVKFIPEESGTWYLVIENCENHDVNSTVKVGINKPSHPVPFLKSEKLDLPGGRLEGKLST